MSLYCAADGIAFIHSSRNDTAAVGVADVVDFFYFKLIDFPIFNVADIYVSVSCVLLAILVIFFYKDEDFDFLGKKKE